ncbi:hypothetical protein [Alteromonas flava]|uniref:hypothetical protein n=1 Tax=Alteromonas flava TaxID=2048003 RepID=UPI000C2878ED|nr:hypothetical protein [Alteromonas flava]
MKKRIWLVYPLVYVCLLISQCRLALAQENWSINGFVAQGIQQASKTNFVSSDGDLSFALTEIGVNGRYAIDEDLSLNAQAVYLNAGRRYPEGARVDYLFLDWRVVDANNLNLNVHLGRYKNYHWLYSSTRDVPHTRPGNLLPQSVYFDSFRDVALGSDGVAIRASTTNRFGDWEFNWSYGKSPVSRESTVQLLGHNSSGKVSQDHDHQMSVYWRSFSSGLLFGVSWLDADFTYNQGLNDGFVNGKVNVQRVALAAQWQSQYVELTTELVRESSAYNDVLAPNFFSDTSAEGGYVQLNVMPLPKLTGLFRLDLYDQNKEDRNGFALEQATNGAIPNYFAYMDTATVGVRYLLADNIALQAEFNRIKGAGRLTPLLVRTTETTESEYWDLWSLQFMYWF